MRIAFADPPYPGNAHLYDHPQADDWNEVSAHIGLIHELSATYPDGWVLFTSAPALRHLLRETPPDTRTYIWAKTFAAFKKGVNPSYAWEPILVRGGRGRTDLNTYTRDWCAEPITLRKGLTGAKPPNLCYWLFDNLNLQPGDEVVDLFPGTGAIGKAWEDYQENYEVLASRINRVSARWEMGKGVLRESPAS